MTKILIPAALIELTGLVQQCLLLSKEQGFNIDELELGISPTQAIQIVSGQHPVLLETDLIGDSYVKNAASISLLYRSTISIEHYLDQCLKSIFIGVSDSQVGGEVPPSQLDIWRHPLNDEVRALSVTADSAKGFEPEYHLAWTVTLLALDFPIEDSLTLARAMTTQRADVSRETISSTTGSQHGFDDWACCFQHFPTPVLDEPRLGIQVGWSADGHSVSFPTLTKQSLGLYPVVDDVAWIERLLSLGINTVQLRIKNAQQPDLEQQVIRAIELGRLHRAQVFINDYWQLAIKHGAYGVHLGQEDIEESNLAQLSEGGIRLGLSTHGYYELLRIVQIRPSYIALGHIFPTTTKQMPSKPQGLVRLALYQKLIDSIPYDIELFDNEVNKVNLGYPTVAIGGIDQSNAKQVWQAGVSSLAVVRAITLADSPQCVVQFFNGLMKQRRTGFFAEQASSYQGEFHEQANG